MNSGATNAMPVPAAVSAGVDFRLAIDAIPALVWMTLPDGHVEYLNKRWVEYTGLNLEYAVGWGWESAIHPDDLPGLMKYWVALLASGKPGETEARLRRFDGVYLWYLFRAIPLHDEVGNVVKWYGTNIEIEDRKRAEVLIAGEKQILEMVAKGQSLTATLEAVCRLVGELSPGTLCSILLLDWARHCFRHGAAPELPESYNREMDGREFEFSSGACARAAKQGDQVIVPDIAADPAWKDRPELPLSHGLKSCWSTPVFSQDGRVIAVFATYSRTPSEPTPSQLHLTEQLTAITSIAIERDRAASALLASEHLARGQLEALAGSLALLSEESEPGKFLEHILQIACDQIGACLANVWELNPNIGCVELAAYYEGGVLHVPVRTADHFQHGPSQEPRDHPVWTDFFRSGKHCVYGKILTEAPWAEVALQSDGPWYDWRAAVVDSPKVPRMIENIAKLGVVATLNVPMSVADEVTGFLTLHFNERRQFRQDEIALTLAMANQAMLAMQLTRLSAQSRQSAIIAERNRMARDIHDSLAQGFAGIIVQLDAAADANTRGMQLESDGHVARASELARESLGEARRSLHALRPRALEEKSLPLALEDLFLKMTSGTPLQLAFTVHGNGFELPPECEENLLRIGQEVLTNALRHASATTFYASLSFVPGGFTLELRDDGRGFDLAGNYEGFGLTGIRERVEDMAGHLHLRSAPGQGTVVKIDLIEK